MPEASEARDPSCILIRNEMGGIVAAHGEVFDVLGWTAEEILGLSSTTLIHPEDQTSAITAWLQMLETPGATAAWRGRYRARAGTWRWVESLNTNNLDDPNDPRVTSSLRPVTVEQVGIEEELRSRKQLISRLSDSLPVGLFQIDLADTSPSPTIACTSSFRLRPPRPPRRSSPQCIPTIATGSRRRSPPSSPTNSSMTSSSASSYRPSTVTSTDAGLSAEPAFADRQHRRRHRRDRLCE